MGSVKLKFVRKVRSKGRNYFYFRKDGHQWPLPHEDDPSFPEEYARLLNGKGRKKPAEGTMSHLIWSYKKSQKFKAMRKTSRRNRERYFNIIGGEYGGSLVTDLMPSHVMDIMDDLSETPGKANNYLATLSVLMNYARKRGLRTDNPCEVVDRLKTGEYRPWPAHILNCALENASPMMRLVIKTHLYSGQRISDCVRIPAKFSSPLEIVQQKTGKLVVIPVHKEWRGEIRAAPRALKATTLLFNRYAMPFSTKTLQDQVRHFMRRIGHKGYTLHGLRKNACVALAEHGCTPHEISSITGQSLEMVQHYTKEAQKKILAGRAIRKWESGKL